MVEIETHSQDFSVCYILEEDRESAEFIDDLAIVDVTLVDPVMQKDFKVKTVLRRIVNTDTNEVSSYKIALDKAFINLNKNVRNITRINRYFIVEAAVMDDEVERYREYHLFEYLKDTNTLVEKGKIPGIPSATMNDDLVVIDPSNGSVCLFSLSKCDIASQEYTMIDDIDGENFLVTDVVAPKNSDNKDYLIFRMDSNGVRNSNVYSRMKQRDIKADIDYPYLLIKEKRIAELEQANKKAEGKRRELRKGNI